MCDMNELKEKSQKSNKGANPTNDQPSRPERIDRRYFSLQVQQIFNVDRGFLYTTREFLLRPGKTIQEFLYEDREKYVKPIVFLIFTSVLCSLISIFLGIELNYFNVDNIQGLRGSIDTGALGEWLNNNIGYTNLIIGVFIALWLKVFVRDYNIYEIIVMLCFVFGVATLILSLAFVLGDITGDGFVALCIMLIFFIYPIWAIGQFISRKKWISYFKSFVVVILGYMSYVLVLILFGYIWNLLWN